MKFKKRFKRINILLFAMLLALISVITPVYAIEYEQKYFYLTIENIDNNVIENTDLYLFLSNYAIIGENDSITNIFNDEIIYNSDDYNLDSSSYSIIDGYQFYIMIDASISVKPDSVSVGDFPEGVSNGDLFVFILTVEKEPIPSVSILQGFVNVAKKVYLDLLPIMGQGLVVGFNALAIVTVGEVTSPTNLVLVLFMWTLLLIAVGAIGKAFGVLRGSRK